MFEEEASLKKQPGFLQRNESRFATPREEQFRGSSVEAVQCRGPVLKDAPHTNDPSAPGLFDWPAHVTVQVRARRVASDRVEVFSGKRPKCRKPRKGFDLRLNRVGDKNFVTGSVDTGPAKPRMTFPGRHRSRFWAVARPGFFIRSLTIWLCVTSEFPAQGCASWMDGCFSRSGWCGRHQKADRQVIG